VGLTPEQAIDSINQVYGRHAGRRALHAKGILCTGTFTATPEAARLTRAAHMQGGVTPATIRFSNGSGNPDAPARLTDGIALTPDPVLQFRPRAYSESIARRTGG
jgi:catalase